MRSRFDEQLHLLNEEMIRMGSMIEQAIENAGRVLQSRNRQECLAIMDFDREIDRKERDIETLCLRLILMQQPVARDLRIISSALKMITDMERIGDHASDIAEILTMPENEPPIDYPPQLLRMAEESSVMVHRAIDAFVNRDVKLAQAVIASDDIVDDLFKEVRLELTRLMHLYPDSNMQIMDILMFAKYFERIGDHAVNIAEWVEYAVTGIYKGESLQ